MTAEIAAEDMARLRAAVGTLKLLVDRQAELAVEAVAEVTHGYVAAAAPTRAKAAVVTKILRRGIDTTAQVHAGGLGHAIVPGSGPHSLKPRLKKAMAWVGGFHPVRGEIVVGGAAPIDYLRGGLRNARSDIEREVREANDRLARDIAQEIG